MLEQIGYIHSPFLFSVNAYHNVYAAIIRYRIKPTTANGSIHASVVPLSDIFFHHIT